MRTPAALEAIAEMKKVDGAIVGAGPVVNTDHLRQVADAGIEFIVSPGLNARLGEAVGETGIPFLPGVPSAGDILRGHDRRRTHFTFFPPETSGAVQALNHPPRPYYPFQYSPTGGNSPP